MLERKFQSAVKSCSSHLLSNEGIFLTKGRMGKSPLDFNAKHPMLLHGKHQVVELFLRNDHKKIQHEGIEHIRNIVQQRIWIIDVRTALRSIKNKHITYRRGRAQTMAPVM